MRLYASSSHSARAADKQVYPALDVVGWYATGAEVQPEDLDTHRRVVTLPAPCFSPHIQLL